MFDKFTPKNLSKIYDKNSSTIKEAFRVYLLLNDLMNCTHLPKVVLKAIANKSSYEDKKNYI